MPLLLPPYATLLAVACGFPRRTGAIGGVCRRAGRVGGEPLAWAELFLPPRDRFSARPVQFLPPTGDTRPAISDSRPLTVA